MDGGSIQEIADPVMPLVQCGGHQNTSSLVCTCFLMVGSLGMCGEGRGGGGVETDRQTDRKIQRYIPVLWKLLCVGFQFLLYPFLSCVIVGATVVVVVVDVVLLFLEMGERGWGCNSGDR